MKGGRAILSDARAQGARPCENPPPTAIVSPVIQPEAGEARNTATEAISFGCPSRPSGVRDTICFSKSLPTMPRSCAPSVSTPPGLMAYADLLRPELLCQHARRGIERAFAGRVDDRGGHRGLARDRADIDDAAAVGAEIFQCLARGEQRPERCAPISLSISTRRGSASAREMRAKSRSFRGGVREEAIFANRRTTYRACTSSRRGRSRIVRRYALAPAREVKSASRPPPITGLDTGQHMVRHRKDRGEVTLVG